MNTIYKVIWDASRSMFVVASEFARSHRKAARRAASAVLLGGIAAAGAGGAAYAADVTQTYDSSLTTYVVSPNC
ncbi:ESPR domain-containing protein [Mesosutterella sp. AGMB02718]|uniref:ESPR domain-containing protein n=1 Tax=Mesosutterella faecium TaxID=2925194 RepID=A0ABT7IQ99_9BURK|nr:ESPR domain-containing protein [Mesosutterella sp. AGMB02718]MDL2060061.1 ESPR domain-containing protein [Mesosutterella sp. AGMB02718]